MDLMDTRPACSAQEGQKRRRTGVRLMNNKAYNVNVSMQREKIEKSVPNLTRYIAFGSYVLLNAPSCRYALTQEAQDKSKENELCIITP